MVPIGPQGHHDHPPGDPDALASVRLSALLALEIPVCTENLDGAMGRSGAESRGATRARNGHTAALFASKCQSFRFEAQSYLRPKPRRFPLDRGFLRSAQGQSGDEASAGHSLAVARTRYIKGRQASREKYITTDVLLKWRLASCLTAIPRAGPPGELRPRA
jgi:hypothetical protein